MDRIFLWLAKQVLFLVLWVFPTEAFIRLVPFLPGRLVVAGLRFYGAKIADNVRIASPVTFHGVPNRGRDPFQNLVIDRDVYIGRHVFLDCQDQISIGRGATLAMGVMVLTHINVGSSPLKTSTLPDSQAPVRIGPGAYLGARAIILQGVSIGQNAVVAAGALVNKDVNERAVVGGIPAQALSTKRAS